MWNTPFYVHKALIYYLPLRKKNFEIVKKKLALQLIASKRIIHMPFGGMEWTPTAL